VSGPSVILKGGDRLGGMGGFYKGGEFGGCFLGGFIWGCGGGGGGKNHHKQKKKGCFEYVPIRRTYSVRSYKKSAEEVRRNFFERDRRILNFKGR